jgi:hypothetical protein
MYNSPNERSMLSGLTLRLSVCGIPTHSINPLAGLLVRWSENSGREWTVKRCKLLKQLLITTHAGNPIPHSLAKNRNGMVKGVVGYLIRLGCSSDKNFFRVLSAFMAYTNWTSVDLTKVQRKKFLEAVNAPVVAIPRDLEDSLVRVTRSTVGCRTIHEKPQPLLTWEGSPNKRAPTLRGSVPQSSNILYELALVDNELTLEHIKRFSIIYDDVFTGIDWKSFADSTHQDDIDYGPMFAGEVHFLQEPGYKLRSIASPYRLFQVASEPLKNSLKACIQDLPWDCTHEQSRAFPVIQEALSNGKLVYSVDLSNATDYFPLELQEIVLQTIFGKECPYVSLFREISRCSWHSDIGVIKWNKGQPLGFNPSFFLFTLTHGLLLRALLGREWNNEFFVVGDDVVIVDHMLYDRYISTLKLLGCPYSPEKTLVSSKLSEFAGKVITQSNVYPQLKWRDISDDNFLDLARLIGPRIRRLLTPKQRRVIDVFAHISNLTHPFGLNWSYPGSNLEKMIRQGMLLSFDERVLGSLTGLSRRINSQLYANYKPYAPDYTNVVRKDDIRVVAETFDEKVLSVFSKLGYNRLASEYFLEGLKDIPETLFGSSNRQLPLEARLPSRVTLLQRLSRFLQRKPRLERN